MVWMRRSDGPQGLGHWIGSSVAVLTGALLLVAVVPLSAAPQPAASKIKASAAKPATDAVESTEKAESTGKPEAEAKPVALKEPFTTGSSDVLIGFINESIRKNWIDNSIEPSQPADDAEWLRRVYLDIVGHIPPVEELEAFLADKNKAKRSLVIDRLLDDPGYVRQATAIWTNLLIGRNAPDGQMGVARRRAGLQKFLREAFAKNRPWSDVVFDLLAAEGHFEEHGEVNFLLTHLNDGAVPATAISARLFLGIQVQCTQCHNHPFNDWKQNQFWEFNSFFKQARAVEHRKYDEKTGRQVFDYAELLPQEFDGGVYFELRNGLMKVAYPKYEGIEVDPKSENRRLELAKLVVAGDRPLIADAIVNRMWGQFFGYGFTKPVDDMGPHNAASHPELLQRLSEEFVKSKYDLKQLIRWICNSEAYNLTSQYGRRNEVDNPANGETALFSHMYVKSMTAEQLYDSLIIATNAHKSGRGSWEQAEQQRQQWMQQFVVAFGTDENDESTTFNGTIPQALMMMNGELVQNAISEKKGSYLNTVLLEKGNEQTKLRELYLSTLSRPPSSREINASKKVLKGAKTPLEAYQDLYWALLNSNEFICNH
jgi:hypothetical protein